MKEASKYQQNSEEEKVKKKEYKVKIKKNKLTSAAPNTL